MTYAILGSGAIGAALARHFARKALPVKIANTRGPQSLAALAAELGPVVSPVSVEEALAADVVILAIPFTAVPAALRGARFDGRIVVDATNAINFTNFTPADLGGRISSDIIAEAAEGARVVKAFNTLPAAVLAAEPETDGARRTIFVSGDDTTANGQVAALVEGLGFAPIVLGRLGEGGRLQQFGGALMVHSLMKQPA